MELFKQIEALHDEISDEDFRCSNRLEHLEKSGTDYQDPIYQHIEGERTSYRRVSRWLQSLISRYGEVRDYKNELEKLYKDVCQQDDNYTGKIRELVAEGVEDDDLYLVTMRSRQFGFNLVSKWIRNILNKTERKVNTAEEVTLAMENSDEIRFVKQLRVDLDKQLQFIKGSYPSNERSLACTRIQEAIMWLGMDLKRIGAKNPYPNSYKPENAVVDPTADGLKL